jgi:hypothetical protein
MSGKLFSAALAASLMYASAAWAQDCSLKQIASLPITTTASGKIAVPVKINGVSGLMAVILDTDTSGVNGELVEQQDWDTEALPSYVKFWFGDVDFTQGVRTQLTRQVKITDLQLGMLDAKDMTFLMYSRWHSNDGIVGVLGSNLLRHFDVEFDFANEKINLFSQDHCAGNVVYWSDAYTSLPLSYNNLSGEVTIPMLLDGKAVTASLSTIRRKSLMALTEAGMIEGFPANSADLKDVGTGPILQDETIYHYPFKELSLGALALRNPVIDLSPDFNNCAYIKTSTPGYANQSIKAAKDLCATDLAVGLDELRKLHLYFAFKENKLYVTAADAHK